MTFDLTHKNTNPKEIKLDYINEAIEKLSSQFCIDYAQIVKNINDDGTKDEYDIPTKRGHIHTYGLLKIKDIAVARTFFAPDTELEKHTHNVAEIFSVIKGSITVLKEGNITMTLKPGDICYIEPNVPHFITSDVDVETEIVVAVLPADKAWPAPKRGAK